METVYLIMFNNQILAVSASFNEAITTQHQIMNDNNILPKIIEYERKKEYSIIDLPEDKYSIINIENVSSI